MHVANTGELNSIMLHKAATYNAIFIADREVAFKMVVLEAGNKISNHSALIVVVIRRRITVAVIVGGRG
jgi:heptaprenylglyceryl phosphate synthase